MMKRLMPAVLLLGLVGCGTVADIAGLRWARLAPPAPHVFGGIRGDVEMLGDGAWHLGPLGVLFFFDLPLSAAADLLLLPISIPVSLTAGKPQAVETAGGK